MVGDIAATAMAAWKGIKMNMILPVETALRFDPLDFFDARVEASGMVVDFRGRITRSFTARFDGVRAGNSINIREKLVYDDGASDQRTWDIQLASPDSWNASANGLVGGAVIRRDPAKPAHSHWTYKMDIPVAGRSLRFAMEDIMTLLEPNRMVALTPMTKFGIKFAHIASEYRRIG
jgi:hypothetical protein